MNKISILFLVQLMVALNTYGQAYLTIEKLPLTKWSGKEKGVNLSNEEKIEKLKMLPDGERIEFIMAWGDRETEEDIEYWGLNTSGLYYIDLDFDGDLDLLYSGVNSGMNQTATKIYYNQNNVLVYNGMLRDGILDIKKNENSYEIYTLFIPCCDSYTSRIEKYKFSAIDTAYFVFSISWIGKPHFSPKGMLDFGTKKSYLINSPSIYGFSKDFIGGYFRERNKEVRTLLKEEKIVELIKIKEDVTVGILGKTIFKDEKYFLIITSPLSNLPKMPISLYEWSEGDGRRLIGWVKAEDIEKK